MEVMRKRERERERGTRRNVILILQRVLQNVVRFAKKNCHFLLKYPHVVDASQRECANLKPHMYIDNPYHVTSNVSLEVISRK